MDTNNYYNQNGQNNNYQNYGNQSQSQNQYQSQTQYSQQTQNQYSNQAQYSQQIQKQYSNQQPVESIMEEEVPTISKKKNLIWVGIIAVLVILFGIFCFIRPEKYAVVFVDGDNVDVLMIKEGKTVDKKQNNNNGFLGWYLNDNEYDFNTKVKENIILKAKYNKKSTYKLTFNTNGGNIIPSISVDEGETADLPVPTRRGYDFVEWKANGRKIDSNTKITSNMELIAEWKRNSDKITYTVKFDSDGGSEISDQIIGENGKATKPKKDPTKTGFKFIEWQLDGVAYDFNLIVNNDLTIQALWVKTEDVVTYNVKFNSDGGTTVSAQVVTENTKAKEPSDKPTKEGYSFKEWQLNGKKFNFDQVITAEIELIAVWEEKENVTVTFDSKGGSTVQSAEIKYNSKVTKPTSPTREGYKFDKWLLNGKEFKFTTSVTTNITLEAKWIEKKYEVSLEKIDEYTPDATLIVKEDDKNISFSKITYNGVTLCTGSNPSVNRNDLNDITTVKVILTGGQEVTAKVVK